MYRRFLSLFLSLILLLVSAGCGGAPPKPEEKTSLSGSVEAVLPAEPEEQTEPEEEPELPPEPEPPSPTVATLAVCGDAMSHMPLTEDAWDGEKYDYMRIMSAAEPLVSAADYAVVNLETTLAGGPPYSGYPCFNSPDDMARALKELGFDLCMTSNNHSLDKGYTGLSRTLDVLDETGLAHVGTSRTQEEADNNIVLADVGGISVAFLGYTYGTNGIPVNKKHPYSINLFNTDYLTTLSTLDKERISASLEAAKAMEPDLIAVMIHWGVEYQTAQNSYQEQIANFLFDHGADIILGGHSHVLQPMEMRTLEREGGESRQGFVCFSLGNFISSQNYDLTDTTAVLTLELTRDNETGVTEVTDFSYAPMFMLDREEGASPRFQLLDAYDALSNGVENPTPTLNEQLQNAIDVCHDILGPEHDLLYVEESE